MRSSSNGDLAGAFSPGKPTYDVAEGMDLIEQIKKLRDEKLELEQSNLTIRKYKQIYFAANQIVCKGCHKKFKPI